MTAPYATITNLQGLFANAVESDQLRITFKYCEGGFAITGVRLESHGDPIVSFSGDVLTARGQRKWYKSLDSLANDAHRITDCRCRLILEQDDG